MRGGRGGDRREPGPAAAGGTEAVSPGRPFAAYWRAWLATYARHHCKPGTVAGYEAAGRLYLIPRSATASSGRSRART